ncbi:hypothetical protein BDB00DRAFT_800110 [Zychaea mexicana]|uniref:uncharacterized protein n=1 Tax=Zychaea mexicana TaxID=64656 RepID=UPI0022FEB15A|nr:uncharacterized protein BDB00DRAFT_800110 [Zychaea mexicana]KAI9498391.1 hypothetical protein BDB00DRAFT_800110 [Zychaea mexicana]
MLAVVLAAVLVVDAVVADGAAAVMLQLRYRMNGGGRLETRSTWNDGLDRSFVVCPVDVVGTWDVPGTVVVVVVAVAAGQIRVFLAVAWWAAVKRDGCSWCCWRCSTAAAVEEEDGATIADGPGAVDAV